MNKPMFGTLLIMSTLSALTVTLLFSEQVQSKDSDYSFFSKSAYRGVKPAQNATYQEECSSCHMAYSPGLLPSNSWQKVMNNLQDHFGDNAELLADTQQQILTYLLANSAEKSKYYRSKEIARSLRKKSTIDRITLSPYFIRKHDEIPKKFVIDNPKVGSFSQCNLCHLRAEQGSFNEDEISIPGVGFWED